MTQLHSLIFRSFVRSFILSIPTRVHTLDRKNKQQASKQWRRSGTKILTLYFLFFSSLYFPVPSFYFLHFLYPVISTFFWCCCDMIPKHDMSVFLIGSFEVSLFLDLSWVSYICHCRYHLPFWPPEVGREVGSMVDDGWSRREVLRLKDSEIDR